MLYCCLSVILTRPKQGAIFHILLFFCENSREGVSKGFFKKHQHRLHCQLSKIPDTSDTIQTGNLWNWNACETDHGVVEKRWMVIPKVWYGSQRAMERLWKGGALAVALVGGCRGQQSPVTGLGTPPAGWPCQGLDRTVCSRATSCGEKPSSTTTKEQEKWSGCPDRLHRQGFPEGLTQTSLQASPFPPSLVETFIPVPWTCCAKVHTISEYTPIYSLLLQRRLTVRGCFPLTPAKCGIEVWGWGAGSLPEWAGRQPDGCPVCLTLLRCHNLHSEVADKHCGSLGFSVCHDDSAFGAVAGMPWASPGSAVHTGSHQHRASLCPPGISFQLCGWGCTLVQETQVCSSSSRHSSTHPDFWSAAVKAEVFSLDHQGRCLSQHLWTFL